MGKRGKQILFGTVFLGFMFPAIQQFFKIFKEKPLSGAFNVPSVKPLTFSNWFNGSFQNSFNEKANYMIGFRTDFVRTRNQIDFSLFNQPHAVNVVKGKGGHLFRYNNFFVTGASNQIEDTLRKNVIRLKQVQELLKARGKFMLYVIAPEKLYYYQEFLPNDNVLNKKSTELYRSYKRLLKEYGCNYIDMNDWFLQMKDTTQHTLYSKGGFHWTRYGAYIGYDSIVSYLQNSGSYSIPSLVVTSLKKESNPWGPDVDILNACNLFIKPKEDLFTYVETKPAFTPSKTTSIFCCDSYFHAVTWPGLFDQTFSKQSTFWYYNREINNTDNSSMRKVKDANSEKIIENADVYVIMFSVMNLDKFDYGFLKHFK